jgi:hypothetical protein
MPNVGDRVRVNSKKVGEAPRDGVVSGVSGQLLRIKWSTGEESTFVPGPGSLVVLAKEKAPPGKKTPGPLKATKASKATKPAAKPAKKASR